MEADLGLRQLKTIENTPEIDIESGDKISSKNFNIKPKCIDEKIKPDLRAEMLGSVTTMNCPGLRTSARVIQKMKQDSVRSSTPPLEKKDGSKDDKNVQKLPSQSKQSKIFWSNIEKTLFFDALNEFGRDFESIANFINAKLKRKNSSDRYKTKDQVRQTFYQTFHKISKYLKFSDEVKKPAQELYALINYGEMRRRLTFVSEKNLMKIKDLVYKGHVTIRSKGKNIRIKTPSCKALRKVNQLEDWLEDIKLPSKVQVCLRPATMESWGKVQALAQNPVIRTVVPLQKKLANVIKTFQQRWRSQEFRISEESLKLIGSGASDPLKIDRSLNIDYDPVSLQEPLLCLTPHKDSTIYRPVVSINDYLSTFNISLNSYEKRIGVKIHGEDLCHDKLPNKRQRTDSGCEKKSPEHKKFRNDSDLRPLDFDISPEKDLDKDLESSDLCSSITLSEEFSDLLNEDKILKFDKHDSSNDADGAKSEYLSENNDTQSGKDQPIMDSSSKLMGDVRQRRKEIKCAKGKKDNKKEISNLKPLISDEVIKQIRKGWTILNSGDITVGDLYVAFGHDSKIMFEYNWLNLDDTKLQQGEVPYSANTNGSIDESDIKAIRQSSISNKLKHLLIIANLNENIRRRPCFCGHTCEKTYRSKVDSDLTSRSYVSNKTYTASHGDTTFRQPLLPFRRSFPSGESFKRISNGVKYRSTRFLKSGILGSKQIVVKRLLPIQAGGAPEIEVKTLQNHFIKQQTEIDTGDNDSDHSDDEDYEECHEGDSVDRREVTAENHHDKQISNINDENIDRDNNSPTTPTGTNNGFVDRTDATKAVTIENDEKSSNVEHSQNESIFDKQSNFDVSELSSLMDLSLPSPLPLPSLDDNTNDTFSGLPAMSPMQIIRETPADPKWLEDNINEFSLSSFLGHLEEINSRDVADDNANVSVLSETSVDYMTKFAEIAASIQNEEKDY